METIGMIIAIGLGLVLGIGAGVMTGSVIIGIVVFLIGAGYLYGKWVEAGVPYDINEIKRKMK